MVTPAPMFTVRVSRKAAGGSIDNDVSVRAKDRAAAVAAVLALHPPRDDETIWQVVFIDPEPPLPMIPMPNDNAGGM